MTGLNGYQFTKKNAQQVDSKKQRIETYDVDGQPLTTQYHELTWYNHQTAWNSLLARRKLSEYVLIDSTIAPGYSQRHVSHLNTYIKLAPGLALASHFALIGTLSLTLGSKSGVLIVPDVRDLTEFADRRHLLTPRTLKECQVSGPADAALQAEVRLRSSETSIKLRVDCCQAVFFSAQDWNKQQRTRATVLDIDPNDQTLDLFEEVMLIEALSPRLATAPPEKKGDAPHHFWSKGVVRPLIAENLARGQPWYRNFRSLIVAPDGRTDEGRVRQLNYETGGLQAMIERVLWQDQGEGTFIESVHQAMQSRFAAIGEETDDPVTFGNRVERQRQRWRLKIAGAKTSHDLRAALADLWSRSNFNPTLQDKWREILPLMCDQARWQLTRDLALLALASYKRVERPARPQRPDERAQDLSSAI